MPGTISTLLGRSQAFPTMAICKTTVFADMQMMAAEGGALQQAKLVLLGDMGAGKSSVVLRFVKGQFFDYQVRICRSTGLILWTGTHSV